MLLEDIKDVELSAGFFENVSYTKGELNISGWMFRSDAKYDELKLYINQNYIKDLDIQTREDVSKVHSGVPHSAHSGFSHAIPYDERAVKDMVYISLVGLTSGKMAGKMETCFSNAVKQITYPIHLMERVAATDNHTFFWALAFRTFSEFWKITQRYKTTSEIQNMMDWGCGCGRLIPLIREVGKIPNIYGCDIDQEAIDWCKENFKKDHFACISPYPPTPYPDNHFDLVFGFSVLTHLTEKTQLEWLSEINRILKSGGLFIATVHGEFAMNRLLSLKAIKNCNEHGINDKQKDGILDKVAPKDYYRGTFQTEKYTRRVYNNYFTILEYIGDGAMNMQDIVVMRKDKSLPVNPKKKEGFFKRFFSL